MTITFAILLTLGLFGGMFLAMEAGHRRAARVAQDEESRRGFAAIEGAIFALFGLLLAFTFSGAASRYDERRQLILAETNALGTAWLRVDLLAPADQPEVRDLLRAYVDARIRVYADGSGDDLRRDEVEAVERAQAALWTRAVAASKAADARLAALFLGDLNESFDQADVRMAVRTFHPPGAIFILLVGLGLLSAFLAGWGLAGSRSTTRSHRAAFVGASCLVVYISLDLELPRSGLIRLGAADHLLQQTRDAMR